MALTDKNIVITPATNTSGQPTIKFSGGSSTTASTTITFKVLDSGPISVEGSFGQLMSIVDSNTGTLFSVNDISGMPSIEVLDTGLVKLAQYSGNVAISTASNTYTSLVVWGAGGIVIPYGSTTQRPAVASTGTMRYNTSTSQVEFYNGSAWNYFQSNSGVITTNLTLYYDFGNTQSYPGTGTAVTDLSGNGNTGTMQTGVTYNTAWGGSMDFNGGTSQITTNYKMPGTARSHFYWVKYNALSTTTGYFLSGVQEAGAYTYIGIQNGGDIYWYMGGASGGTITGYTLSTGTWYQLGQTMSSGGTVTIYKNGIAINTTTGATVGNASTNNFSAGAINNNYYLNGAMGVVTVYNTDLSPAQVSLNYNTMKARYGY